MNQPEDKDKLNSKKPYSENPHNDVVDDEVLDEKTPIFSNPSYVSSTQKSNKTSFFSFKVATLLLFGIILGTGIGYFLSHNNYSFNSVREFLTGESTKTESDTKKNQAESPVLTVEVIAPKVGKMSTSISADGTVTAKNTASINSKVNGMAIEKVLVEEGQWVSKGDPLAIFDTQSIRQNVIQAEANVMQADVNLTKSKADLERVQPLLKIGAVSHQEVDMYVTHVKQAQTALVSAKAQFNNQKINFQDAKLLSPVSGIISQKNAQVGSIPQGAIFTIIEDGRLEWRAELHPEKVNQIKIGTPVAVKLNNDSNDNRALRGKVSRIDPVANANRQIAVYVTLESKKSIQSGMLLKGEFLVGSKSQIIVPVSAVVGSDGYDYVMAVDGLKTNKIKEGERKGQNETTGRVKRIKVELGEQYGDAVALKTHIKNAPIIRQGGSFLSDGDLVRVIQ